MDVFDLVYRFDPSNPDVRKSPVTSEDARLDLMKGNRDFAEMTDINRTGKEARIIPFDPRAFGWGVAAGEAPVQAPFAAVLGCADARVPTEMVFSKGCNELFVVRVAGNVLGAECLGSLGYAVQHFPSTLKLLVVLAHARCGAVTEAVDVYREPRRYINMAADPALRSIADQILIAVRVAAIALEVVYGFEASRKSGYRAALLEAAVVLNAAWSAYCLHREFAEEFPDMAVAFGAYDLSSRYVRLPLSPSGEITEEEKGLFPPPKNENEFSELALRICRGKLIQSLIG
jgi:carbonic anhydrase